MNRSWRLAVRLLSVFLAISVGGEPTNEVTGGLPASQPAPLPTLTVTEKTYENVSLTGFDGTTVVISHSAGVANLPVTVLKPDQIRMLNGTSEKIKVTVEAPPPPPAPVVPPIQSAEPRPADTNAVPAVVVPPVPPPENPAIAAEAAAQTETMIQGFKSLSRSGSEIDHEDEPARRISGFIRFLAWLAFFTAFIGQAWLIGTAIHETDSMTWALLIFFLNPISGFVYWLLHMRTAAIPYAIYAGGFLTLTAIKIHYGMSFFQLLM
jgi:hypothetical protein